MFVEGVLVHDIVVSRAGTFYTRHGDVFAFAQIGLLTILFVWSYMRCPRFRTGTDEYPRDCHRAGRRSTSDLAGAARRGGRAFAIVTTFMAVVALVSLVYSVRIVGNAIRGVPLLRVSCRRSFGDLEWPGIQAGARYQDIIVEADGQRIATSSELQTIVARTAVGERVRYVLSSTRPPAHHQRADLGVTITDFVLLFGPTFVSGLFFGSPALWCTASSRTQALHGHSSSSALPRHLSDRGLGHSGSAARGMALSGGDARASILSGGLDHLSLLFPERTRLIERRAWLQYVPYAVAVGWPPISSSPSCR